MGDNYGNDFISATELMNDIVKDVQYSKDLSDYPVEAEIINFEEEMENDLATGNGFIITDKNGLDKSKTVRMENGIYSPKYGSIWGDENAFEELYSCKCGNLKAKMNRGKLCPNCGEPVKFRDKNVHMTGWLQLDNYKLIHPNIYYKLCSLIGYKRMKAILRVEWETDITGNPIKPIIDDDSKNILKYDNIGILEFQKRFDEICKFFLHKKKDKKDAYDFIMKHRDSVFTSCFPILPLFLRPIVLGEEDFNFVKLNRKYAMLSAKFYNINDKHRYYDPKEEKILLNRLYSIQLNYFYTCDMIMDMMNKKEGLIRNDILGFRSNFSVRAVITPLSGTRINEIHFPYLGFLEMYRFEILNTLTKLVDITINEASIIWERAKIKFDKRVYACMQYIIEHTDCYILLNRNPKGWGLKIPLIAGMC